MSATATIELAPLARALGLPTSRVEAVVALLDGGNTVPFITRYRKDQSGGMDEERIRQIEASVLKMRLLAERKQTILRSIESQGKLTPELAQAIEAADTTKRLEDLYLPFKPKKQTLATLARSRGLEDLANEILAAAPACADLDARARDFVNPDRQLATSADALLGAGHILAESFSERADLRGALRAIVERTGRLCSTGEDRPAPEPKENKEGKPKEVRDTRKEQKDGRAFRDYYQYSEALAKVPPHRVLAINRGERAKILKVKIEVDLEAMVRTVNEMVVTGEHPHADFLRGCGQDALTRLVLPSLEREFRRELTDRAETHAVEVFARNLRNLLLQAPIRDRRVLAIDPGFKSGCKLAAIDEFGKLLDHGVIHLVGSEERRAEAKNRVLEMVRQHQLTVVAIGNGTACRETELWIGELLAAELANQSVAYVIVNEAGASVYSTSRLGRDEFPEYDATLRGAISIGRRLQDPLSELVKIDAANIGVGMYQHDVKVKHLRDSLDAVVASCVNYVGVDLNTASPALLRYVSGLNQLTAQRVFDHRNTYGPIKSREDLKLISGFGEAAFVQAAGFLKITGGTNPLDATWIHPESYPVAERILGSLNATPADLGDKAQAALLAERVNQIQPAALAADLQVGELTLGDIVSQLVRPGRDPRESLPQPIFKHGVLKLEDLTSGMELRGTVLNVVDFGAFVDVGLKDTGLVHISQLANRYVPDPHQVVAVGDIVRVWVREVDKERRRVSLSMIPPGSAPAQQRGRGGPRVDAQDAAGGAPPRRRRPGARPSGAPTAGAATHASARKRTTAPTTAPNTEQRTGEAPAGEQAPDASAPGDAAPSGQQAPRHGARHANTSGRGAAQQGNKPKFKSGQRSAPAPKPLRPLSDDMKKGKAPLRTFGDLKQFIALQQEPPQAEGQPPPSQ